MKLFKFDWKKSEGHLLLLSKFLKPGSPLNYRNAKLWKVVLKENPSKAIERFFHEGYLVNADIFGLLDCCPGLD